MKSSIAEVASPSNVAFFDQYAKAGMVGLVGGARGVDATIRKAQRKLVPDGSWSDFSHAFVVVGAREDGHVWCLESDIELLRERVRIGVQENRVEKYADAASYPRVAVLDFGLTAAQTKKVLGVGLDLLARRTQYSLREILGAYWSLRKPSRRRDENALAQERAMFCSAFVQHLFLEVGIDFAPDVATKLTLPHDIAMTPVPHRAWVRRARGV
jgi:hypothetical protein